MLKTRNPIKHCPPAAIVTANSVECAECALAGDRRARSASHPEGEVAGRGSEPQHGTLIWQNTSRILGHAALRPEPHRAA